MESLTPSRARVSPFVGWLPLLLVIVLLHLPALDLTLLHRDPLTPPLHRITLRLTLPNTELAPPKLMAAPVFAVFASAGSVVFLVITEEWVLHPGEKLLLTGVTLRACMKRLTPSFAGTFHADRLHLLPLATKPPSSTFRLLNPINKLGLTQL